MTALLLLSHEWNDASNTLEKAQDITDEGISGTGAIVSTIDDYAKWIRSLIQKSTPLSAAGHAALIHPRIVVTPGAPGGRFTGADLYALGWLVGVYWGEGAAYHPGGLPGFMAYQIFFPDRKFGVVGMMNCTSSGGLYAPPWRLIEEAFNAPEKRENR